MSAKAVSKAAGLGGEAAAGWAESVIDNEALPERCFEVAQSEGTEVRTVIGEKEVSGIEVVTPLAERFAGVFFGNDAGVQAIVERIGILQGVVERFAEISFLQISFFRLKALAIPAAQFVTSVDEVGESQRAVFVGGIAGYDERQEEFDGTDVDGFDVP